MNKPLRAYVDFETETNQWCAACNDCAWIAHYNSSGKANNAADWHDVEIHEAFSA